MRLAAKITFALCAVLIAGLTAQAIFARNQVTELYQREAEDDVRIRSRALASAAEQLWALAGEAEARRFIRLADEQRAYVHVELLAPRSANIGRTTVHDTVVGRVETIVVDDKEVAELRVTRTYSPDRRYLDNIRSTQIWTTILLVIACMTVSIMLGVWLIGRPVDRLVQHARQLGDGAFPLMDEANQHDEIGRLAREMKAMGEKLQAASSKASTERRKHAAVLQRLRHADRLSTVGKLASSIAHEMGTPLNVVSGRAAMIAAGDLSPEQIESSAETIQEQAQRLSAIIEELLQFSRREGLRKASMSVGDVLEHAKVLIEPLADDHDVCIEIKGNVDIDAELDSGKTLQILTNLIVNGVQAMPDGGVLTIGATAETVDKPRDRRSKPGRYVVVTVEDQGTGIATEDLEHIFEAFFTTKRAGQGTGLGLSVCAGIVREHGGWIDVDSKLGRGTKFSVYLPREDVT